MREERQRVSERARVRVGTVVVASCLALLAPRLACGAEAAPGSTSGGDDPCSIRDSLRRTRPDPEGPPVRIEVGLFLVDVIEINEVLESFKVDIRLQLQWQDSRLSAKARGGSLEECRLRLADIWHPEVDLINQRTDLRRARLAARPRRLPL